LRFFGGESRFGAGRDQRPLVRILLMIGRMLASEAIGANAHDFARFDCRFGDTRGPLSVAAPG
jgi:hypothetical protein